MVCTTTQPEEMPVKHTANRENLNHNYVAWQSCALSRIERKNFDMCICANKAHTDVNNRPYKVYKYTNMHYKYILDEV